MKTLFFYGTLRHLPLLEIILGRAASDIQTSADGLSGYQALSVQNEPFPALTAMRDGVAQGLCVTGLSDADIARLNFYEGSFDYDLETVTLQSGQAAEVYLPTPGRWQTAGPWDLEAWKARWAEMSCHAAREVMGYFGSRSRAEIDGMFPVIRARATAKVNAARSLHGAGLLDGKVSIEAQTRVYSKFFALDELMVRHERFDGSLSDTLDRAVFVPVDAVCLLPYDPVRDRVLLVEQFRMGPLVRGDRSVWQLELVAGRIDAGESPEEAARREAHEEAGLEITGFEEIAQVYPSPGSSSEFYYILLALCDLPDTQAGVGGLACENEDIRSHILSFDALMDLCDSQQSANAAQTIAAYWLARHRERLRLARGADTS